MIAGRRIWLVVNDASGSNSEQELTSLKRSCHDAGLAPERVITFPDEPLPTASQLRNAGVELVAVFAGDGTVNALINALAGWSGAVLVLLGGTMNLLYHRLHGDRDIGKVLRSIAMAQLVRPQVVACDRGTALADLLAGPGTCWYDVREAMREADVLGVAGGAARALGETLARPGIACSEPALGRPEGYPLVMLTPSDAGIRISGFYAETPAEFFEGGWAMLRRRFREGPHDDLGLVNEVTLASTAEEPFGILIDGERAQSAARQVFRLVPCAVDLLATQADGR